MLDFVHPLGADRHRTSKRRQARFDEAGRVLNRGIGVPTHCLLIAVERAGRGSTIEPRHLPALKPSGIAPSRALARQIAVRATVNLEPGGMTMPTDGGCNTDATRRIILLRFQRHLSDFESEGREFESLRARQNTKKIKIFRALLSRRSSLCFSCQRGVSNMPADAPIRPGAIPPRPARGDAWAATPPRAVLARRNAVAPSSAFD